MRRLVLDAGPLIALVSQLDSYHDQAKQGFGQIPNQFGEVITPLPILFEVYKFVFRNESAQAAQFLLTLLQEETVIAPIDEKGFLAICDLVTQTPQWQGTLEDASVFWVAQEYQAEVWTLDYKDLGYFKTIQFWAP